MKKSTASSYQERILRTLVHIQQHLDEPLALEDLARVAAFSTFHFHRIFGAMVGESVKEHVRRLRLERAAQRLKLNEQPVTNIAFDAGYEAHEAFTRAFHAMFGVSPSEYRAAHRPFPESPSKVHYGDTAKYRAPAGAAPVAVAVRPVAPMRIAFVRHVGPYDEVSEAWNRLMGWAGRKGLLGPAMLTVGIVHDSPDITPAEKLRYDAGLAVPERIEGEGEIGIQVIGGGEYATATHRGPYNRLSETYNQVYGMWLPGSGRELRDVPAFEQYLNAPQFTPPEQLLTVIHAPLS